VKRRSFMIGSSTLAAVLATSNQAYAAAAAIVVVHPRNPTNSLTKPQLRALFLGSVGFWHGVVPVKLLRRPPDSAASLGFFEPLLGMTPGAFQAHWDKLQLSGKAIAPPILDSVDELVAKIGGIPGAIGFVGQDELGSAAQLKKLEIK